MGKSVICGGCGIEFARTGSMITHICPGTVRYACAPCKLEFNTEAAHTRHYNAVHSQSATDISLTGRYGMYGKPSLLGRFGEYGEEPLGTDETEEKAYGVYDEPDPVNHPKHYSANPDGVECIQVTRHMNFNVGNAVKYLWRAGKKDSTKHLEDLKKAAWYIADEIARVEANED